jgi:hypothetical protein
MDAFVDSLLYEMKQEKIKLEQEIDRLQKDIIQISNQYNFEYEKVPKNVSTRLLKMQSDIKTHQHNLKIINEQLNPPPVDHWNELKRTTKPIENLDDRRAIAKEEFEKLKLPFNEQSYEKILQLESQLNDEKQAKRLQTEHAIANTRLKQSNYSPAQKERMRTVRNFGGKRKLKQRKTKRLKHNFRW